MYTSTKHADLCWNLITEEKVQEAVIRMQLDELRAEVEAAEDAVCMYVYIYMYIYIYIHAHTYAA